jgi:hypothetical protein
VRTSLAFGHDRRKGRGNHVRPIRPDDEVDFVDFNEFRVNARDGVWPGLIVVIDELDGPAKQATLGIDFFLPDLGAEQRLLAGARERTSLSHTETDLD